MKRISSIRFTLFFLVLILLSVSGNEAQSQTIARYNEANWLKGLKLHPHRVTDKPEFVKQYKANKEEWDKAFAFLRDNNLDSLKTGNYVIDGKNVYADITDNPSSPLKEAKWHSHRQFCDIIYVIKGKESIGIAPIATAPIIIPFNGKGDSQFYNQEMKGNYYLSNPDTFFILLPTDVHRPFIKVEGCDRVKRIRIKIKSI